MTEDRRRTSQRRIDWPPPGKAVATGLAVLVCVALAIGLVVGLGGGGGDDDATTSANRTSTPRDAGGGADGGGGAEAEVEPPTHAEVPVDTPIPRAAAKAAGERLGHAREHKQISPAAWVEILHKPDGAHYRPWFLRRLEQGRRTRLVVYLGAADALGLSARALGLDVPRRIPADEAVPAGRRLSQARRRAGYSLPVWAEELHTPEGDHYPAEFLSNVERGRVRAPLTVYLGAADVLLVKPSTLLGEDHVH